MSLLGAPLDRELLDALRDQYPAFQGKLPDEAVYWTQADVERFLGSDGAVRPPEAAQKQAQTCALLTRLRLKLAEEKISDATAEYRSFCRYLKEHRDAWRLPSVAECAEVPRAKAVPRDLRAPLLVEKPRDWRARMWNLDFWRGQCGGQSWVCRSRNPRFQDDPAGADSFAVEATLDEFAEYVRLLHRLDRKCSEDNAVACPRVSWHGWPGFCGQLLPLFAETWAELGPPGVKDATPRWVQQFAQAFRADACEALARFYTIGIRPTGAVTRLHMEAHSAHLWVNQIEGRTLFFLFSPQEALNLHGTTVTGESPVDIFFPSSRRHPRVAEAKAQVVVLHLGQTLLIPAGWWWYSAALEPSVTLSHHFWNMENRVHFSEALKDLFELAMPGPRGARENAAMNLDAIHDQVMADEDSEGDL